MRRVIQWQFLGCLFLLWVTSIPLLSQSTTEIDSIPSNADLFRSGLLKFTDSLVQGSSVLRGSSLVLSVHASDEQPLVEQSVIAGVTHHGCNVYLDSTSDAGAYQLTLTGVALAVRYQEPFHEQLFGESKSQRMVKVTVPFTLSERQTGKVLRSETIEHVFADTVATGEISQLEQQHIPSTIAPLPDRSFFDKLLEPLLIIGSTGVAIFLFFHIRS